MVKRTLQVKRTRQILTIPIAKEGSKADLPEATEPNIKYRHHHHWQKVRHIAHSIGMSL